MMQSLIVDVVVIAAAVYATWRLSPAALRRRWAAALGNLLRRRGISAARVARFEQRATAGACGACDGCSGCAASAATPSRDRSVVRVTRAE